MSTPAPTDTRHSDRRRRLLWLITAGFLLLAAGYLIYWLLIGRFFVSTDDAYVRGNLVPLTARVAGTVTAITGDDTDLVRAGSPVVMLDPTNARLKLDQAEAALAAAVRSARAARAQWHALQSAAQAAHVRYELAASDERRRRHLAAIDAISRESWRHTRATAQTLAAQYRAAVARARAQQAVAGTRPLRRLPAIRQAMTAVKTAYLDLTHCVVRAPVTGYIAKRHVQLGQRVTAHETLLVIIPLQRLWVSANFKETDLGSLRIGQPARVVADIYGDKVVYHGRVAGIGAGTGSAFALLPPSNASGNWIKIVQRVPVRISLPSRLLAQHPLRVGLSTDVTVNIHHTKGPVLASRPPAIPRYRTDIYGHALQGARVLIDKILQANGAQVAAHGR